MRIGRILLIIWLCCLGTLSKSQSKVELDVAGLGFSDFMGSLSEMYDVEFSYASNMLSDYVFSLETKTPDLSDVLDILADDHDLEYIILADEKILIREKLEAPTDPISTYRKIKIQCKDQLNGLHVPGAAIGIEGTTKGVYTRDDGSAVLSIPNKNTQVYLKVHMLGYKEQKVLVNQGQNSIEVELELLPFSIEEVMVKDRSDIIQSGEHIHSVSFKSNSITSLSSGIAGKDLVREVQLMPGVVSFQDRNAGMKIRGGSEASSMMLIDDIPIYHSGHYYGLFSSAHPSYTQSATLYKNNLPLSFDGKADGLLALDGPSLDSSTQTKSQIDLSLLTVAAHSDIALGNRMMLSVAGRTSIGNISEGGFLGTFTPTEDNVASTDNFRLVNRRQLISSTPDYEFYDINSSLQYKDDNWSVDLSYYRSDDDLTDDISNTFRSRAGRDEVVNTELYGNKENWLNQGISLQTSIEFSPSTSFNAQLYHTELDNTANVDITLSRETRRGTRTFNTSNDRVNIVRDYGFKSEISHDFNFGEISGGVDIIDHSTTFEIFEKDESVRLLGSDAVESALFMAFRPRINESLDFEVGIRATSYQGGFYPAPRLSANYRVNPNLEAKLSLGRHNQYVRQLTYENPFGRSLDIWYQAGSDRIDVGHTDHVMLGFLFEKDRFSIDVEGYYKRRLNMIEQALFGSRFDEMSVLPSSAITGNIYELFEGEGQTLGVDVLMTYTQPKYAAWLSYTLSKSTVQFDRILRRTAFPTQDDRRHQLNLVGQYFIGDFTIGATAVYASGRPYTDLDKILSELNRDELRPQDRLSRLPAYIRGDLGVSYQVKLPSSTLDIGLSAFNVLNRKNVNYIQYLFSVPSNSNDSPDRNENILLGTESNLLGRTLNLSLSYSF